jgi:hypothetical protein
VSYRTELYKRLGIGIFPTVTEEVKLKQAAIEEVDRLREQLGLIVDTCDNGLAALRMPLPDSIHKEGLTGVIESVKRLATPPFNAP